MKPVNVSLYQGNQASGRTAMGPGIKPATGYSFSHASICFSALQFADFLFSILLSCHFCSSLCHTPPLPQCPFFIMLSPLPISMFFGHYGLALNLQFLLNWNTLQIKPPSLCSHEIAIPVYWFSPILPDFISCFIQMCS